MVVRWQSQGLAEEEELRERVLDESRDESLDREWSPGADFVGLFILRQNRLILLFSRVVRGMTSVTFSCRPLTPNAHALQQKGRRDSVHTSDDCIPEAGRE